MTLEEALNIPMGMDFQEYEKLLKDKKRLERQIRKASDDIDTELDSLEVLSDEVGSELYNKHLLKKQYAEAKKEKALSELKVIIERIG